MPNLVPSVHISADAVVLQLKIKEKPAPIHLGHERAEFDRLDLIAVGSQGCHDRLPSCGQIGASWTDKADYELWLREFGRHRVEPSVVIGYRFCTELCLAASFGNFARSP